MRQWNLTGMRCAVLSSVAGGQRARIAAVPLVQKARRAAVAVLAALAVCVAQRPALRATDASPFAFAHVAVVDVERGRLVEDQTVVISGDRILAAGPSSSIVIPAGAAVIDGTNRFLSPGFADMHVHLYTEGDAFTYLANGITTVRNMAGDPSHLALRRRTAAGDVIGPRIITAGPVIETRRSHPDNAFVATASEARQEVARQHAAGYDFIKIYNDITPDTYQAIVEAARELKMPVAGHVPDAIGLRGVLAAGQRSIEHLRGYASELLPPSRVRAANPTFDERTRWWNAVDPAGMTALAKATAAAGTWNCPTFAFTVHELSPSDAHWRLVARPETGWLSLEGLPKDRSKGYLSGFSEADFAAAQRGLQAQYRLLRALDEAGAGLLVGTDSWLSGFAFADELELLVEAGLSPARVLKMATFDAARFLSEQSDRGAIGAGRVADIVVLGANPLVDIGNVRKVDGVVHGGRFHDRASLDAMLAALRQEQGKR